MASIGPRQSVDAPRFAQWRPGLVRAARAAGTYIESPVGSGATETGGAGTPLERWANGIGYRPERPFAIDDGGLVQLPGSYITCPVDAGGTDETAQDPKDAHDEPATVDWDPYAIYDRSTCTTLSTDTQTERNRAERSLALQTSHLLENVLWTGEVNGLDFTVNHPNTALASSDATLPNGTAPLGVVSALSLMIEALSDTLGGAQGMIHAPARLIPFLTFYGQLNRIESANYLMAGDHLVVTGTGYPGTDPDGVDDGNIWIYGTSFVEVRLSGIFSVPSDGTGLSGLDKDINDIAVTAERLALASWDRSAHVGIAVCVPDPGPDCAVTSS